MRELVTFSVAVHPLARPALVSNGHGGVRYQGGAAYQEYKRVLRRACEEALPAFWSPYDGPAEIRIVAQYLVPASRRGQVWKVTAPDEENLLKPIQDSMTGLVYSDDRTVSVGGLAKILGDEDRVTVQVNAVTHEEAEQILREVAWPRDFGVASA